MPLIVYSKSTEKFAKNMDTKFLRVDKPPTEKTLELTADDEIIAIGGGSVIDTAKIIAAVSKNQKVMAIPTTASGAEKTGHAVYWKNGRKYSIKTPMPEVNMNLELLETLPKDIIRATSYDALSHALESLWSKKATLLSDLCAQEAIKVITNQIMGGYPDLKELIRGGDLGGRAIEITGTNIVHALSYPLTGFYNVSHGLAVGLILPAVAKYVGCKPKIPKYKINIKRDFDFNFIAEEAMNYAQIHDAIKNITKNKALAILKESL